MGTTSKGPNDAEVAEVSALAPRSHGLDSVVSLSKDCGSILLKIKRHNGIEWD